MKRITLVAGHYGSGKTNIAVNLALKIKKSGVSVVVVDLDIVNPYFRTKDSQDLLNKNNIELISSKYAGSNVDFPALPSSAYSIIDNKKNHVIIDIGGDDRGAYALGRYKDKILDENNYEMLWVVNKYRPLTNNETDALTIKKEIEMASGIKFTGIINNSNIGMETSFSDISNSIDYVHNLSKKTDLPIKMTTIADFVKYNIEDAKKLSLNNIFKIHLQYYGF